MTDTSMRYQDCTCYASVEEKPTEKPSKSSVKWHIPSVIKSASVYIGGGGGHQFQGVINYCSSRAAFLDMCIRQTA